MGITDHSLASRLQVEANKCWFYGLEISILLSLYQLLFPAPQPIQRSTSSSKPTDEKKATNIDSAPAIPLESTGANKSFVLYEQIVIDAADLFLPGSALGWIPVSTLVVGIAGTISTTVAGGQIWRRMQADRRQRNEESLAKIEILKESLKKQFEAHTSQNKLLAEIETLKAKLKREAEVHASPSRS